jgi:alpha-L-fucosidase
MGVINRAQAERLIELNNWVKGSFGTNLLRDARLSIASAPAGYNPADLLRETRDCPCVTPVGTTTLSVEAEFAGPTTFDNLLVEESLELGQHVSAFELESWRDGAWKTIASGRTIGHKRAISFGEVTAQKVRFRVTDSRANPAIRFLGLFKALPYREGAKKITDADYLKALPARDGLVQGLKWSLFADANNGFLPYQELFSDLDTKKVSPDATGIEKDPMSAFLAMSWNRNKKEHFAMRFDGYFQAPSRAVYSFKMGATSGCRLYVDGKKVIENDASGGKPVSVELPLDCGLHSLTLLSYFGAAGKPDLNLVVEWPGNVGDSIFGSPSKQRLLSLLWSDPVNDARNKIKVKQ